MIELSNLFSIKLYKKSEKVYTYGEQPTEFYIVKSGVFLVFFILYLFFTNKLVKIIPVWLAI